MTKIKAQRVYVNGIPNLDPSPFYESIASENGIDRIILPSGHISWHIKKYDEVQKILLDRHFIREPSNREGAATVFPTLTPRELLLNSDGAAHSRLKSLVSKDFSHGGVSTLNLFVRNIIDERIDWMRHQSHGIDLCHDFLDHVPSRTVCKFLGIQEQDMDYFRPLSYTVQIASRQNIP